MTTRCFRPCLQVADRFPLLAKSVERIDSDFSDDVTWLQRLKASGFDPKAKTIWVSIRLP